MNTVYLVDDDPIILEYLMMKRGLFTECGFEICGAETDPFKALAEIREKRPNVLISDLKMPDLSGIGLFKQLSNDWFKPFFVLVSAYSDFADVRQFFTEFDGFDYILKPLKEHNLTDLLNRLAARISKGTVAEESEHKTTSRHLNEIIKYMNEYPAMNHSLEALAERFFVNPNTICNLFARHLNTTFRAYLTTLRLEKAKELLRFTDLAVKEVGISCGYMNYFYFTRVFDKAYGKTPTEYRRELREKQEA